MSKSKVAPVAVTNSTDSKMPHASVETKSSGIDFAPVVPGSKGEVNGAPVKNDARGISRQNSSMAFVDPQESKVNRFNSGNEIDNAQSSVAEFASLSENKMKNAAQKTRKRMLRLLGALSLAAFRRLYRVVMFAFLCRYTFAFPFIALVENILRSETVEFPLKTSQIRLVNSNLNLLDATQSGSSPGSSMSLQITKSRMSDCKTRFLTISGEDKVPVFEDCTVTGLVKGNLPPIKVVMLSTTSTPSTLVYAKKSLSPTLNISSMTLSGNYVDVSIRGVHVTGDMDIELGSGDISLIDVDGSYSSNVKATTGDGNVLVVLRRNFQVYYANYENAICLSSPKLEILSEVCDNQSNTTIWESSNQGGERATNTSASSGLTNCRGHSIMQGYAKGEDTANLPSLNVSSAVGSLYVAMIPQGKVTFASKTGTRSNESKIGEEPSALHTNANKTAMMVKRSKGIADTPRLGVATERYIQSLVKSVVGEPSAVIFSVFNGGRGVGFEGKSSTRLVYASRDTYLGIEPWVLELFSGSILGPKLNLVPLRWTQPLPCPLSFHLDSGGSYYDDNVPMRSNSDIVAEMEVVRSRIDERLNRVLAGVMAQKVVDMSDAENSMPLIGPVPEVTNIGYFDRDNGRTGLTPMTRDDITASIILITMSIFVASITSFAGSSLIVLSIKNSVRGYFGQIQRVVYMQKLKKVLSSTPYQEPKFKEAYVKRLEAADALEAQKKEQQGQTGDDDGDDQDEEDHNNSTDDELGILDTKNAVWFPFAIPMMIRDVQRRAKLNSLKIFLTSQTRSIAMERSMMKSLVPLRDFKEFYHAFCFDKRMQPQSFGGSNVAVMERFGLTIKTLYDHRTDAFTKIRLCTRKERRERMDINPFPRETTLSFFVRTRCIISPFEIDYCTFRRFSHEYERFTNQNAKVKRCRAVPVTKREMLRLGVNSTRKQLKFISARILDIEGVTSQVNLLSESKVSNYAESDKHGDATNIGFLFWDVVNSLEYAVIISVLAFPLVVLPLVAEARNAVTSARPDDAKILIEDLLSWDAPMYNKMVSFRMSYTNIIALGLGLFTIVVCTLEVIMYDIFQPFTLENLQFSRVGALRKLLHNMVYTCGILCIHCWVGYLALVLIWMILGAILDPYKFLPYAAAAGVVVSFVAIKVTLANKSFKKKFALVKSATQKRFAKSSAEMLPLLRRSGSSGAQSQENQNKVENKALELVEADTFLQKVLHRSQGIDLLTALGLARGSSSSQQTASRVLGMNRSVLHAIVAAARLDNASIIESLVSAGEKKSFGEGIDGKLLKRIFRLSQRQSEQSMRLAVKDILTHNVTLAEVSPHTLEAIIAMGRGQISRIVDVLEEFDEENGDNNPEVRKMAGFLELVRNEGTEFQELTFNQDWTNLVNKITDLRFEYIKGVADLCAGRVRTSEACIFLEESRFGIQDDNEKTAVSDDTDASDENMGIDLASLIIGVAKDLADEVRVYGPGSQSFSRILYKISGLDIHPAQLQGLMAIARGCLIEVDQLANILGIKPSAGTSIAHLLAEPNCFGNPFIGLRVKNSKKKSNAAGHVQWIARCFGLEPSVYMGMTCLARRTVSDPRATEAVSRCIKWFADKIPNDMENDDEWYKLLQNLAFTYSSQDVEQTKASCSHLLWRWDFWQGVTNRNILVDLILFARGLIDPHKWLQRAQKEEFGPILKLPKKEFDRFQDRFYWSPKVEVVNQDEGGGEGAEDKEDRDSGEEPERKHDQAVPIKNEFTFEDWRDKNVERISILKIFRSAIHRSNKARRKTQKDKATRKLDKLNSRLISDILQIETSLPKAFISELEQIVSKEQARKIASFALLPVASTLKTALKNKMYGSLAAILALPTDSVQNLLKIFNGNTNERLDAIVNTVSAVYEDDKEYPKKVRIFGEDIIRYAQAAINAHFSIEKTADHLNQPRFMFHVISRDHEPDFGASASGAADLPLQNSILEFLKHLEPYENKESVRDGMLGIVRQDADMVSSFSNIIGLKNPGTLQLVCQLFGNVEVAGMIEHIETLIKRFEKIGGKRIKFLDHFSSPSKLKYKRHSCLQPNPLSKYYQFWNFILMLFIAYYVTTIPLDLLGIFSIDLGIVFECVAESVFLIDVLISFYTPYWLKKGGFEVRPSRTATHYVKTFFLPDVLASLPVSLLTLLIFSDKEVLPDGVSSIASYVKPIKVLRSLRVLRLLKTVKRVLSSRHLSSMAIKKKPFSAMDYVKSFVVLAAEENIKIRTSNVKDVAIHRPTDILTDAVPGMSPAMLHGLFEVHKGNQAGVKEQLIRLSEDGLLTFPESVVRGLTSLATGEVDSIEDVATALKFDPDVAEGLAFVASSVTIDVDHAALSSSSSLNKLCDKLGVEQSVIAALLAIVNQDFEAGEEINTQLTLVDINDQFLSAVMAVYSDDQQFVPNEKTTSVENFLAPLSRLYVPRVDPAIAAALVRLGQGDVSTIKTILGDELGWSKSERDIVASLALCAQRDFQTGFSTYMQKKQLDFRPSEGQDWDTTRDAGVCARKISNVLRVRQEIVYILISACHGEEENLQRLADIVDGKMKEQNDAPPINDKFKIEKKMSQNEPVAKTTINDIVSMLKTLGGVAPHIKMGYDFKNDGEGQAEGDNASVASGASSVYSTGTYLTEGTDVGANTSSGQRDSALEIRRSKKAKKSLIKIVQKLNEIYDTKVDEDQDDDNSNASSSLNSLNEEVAHWLVRLCHGDVRYNNWKHLTKFIYEARLREKEKQGTPALTMISVAQVLQIALLDSKHWGSEDGENQLMTFWDITNIYEDERILYEEAGVIMPETEDNFGQFPEGGILETLGFQNLIMGPKFITMLASGDADVWYLESGDGVVSSKIYPDTRIIAAFAGLAAQDKRIIDLYLKTLCSLIGTDAESCGSIIRLAMGDYERLNAEIDKITRRIGSGTTKELALGFCAGCSLDPEQVTEMLTTLCNDLDLEEGNGDGIAIASSIVLAAQCKGTVSRDAWRTLCQKLLLVSARKLDGEVSDEDKKKPIFWMTEAVGSLLAHDAIKVREYSKMIDEYFGLADLWQALLSKNEKQQHSERQKLVRQNSARGLSTPKEREKTSEETFSTCAGILYSIATNDMSKLIPVLKILGVKEANVRKNACLIVKLFNRQASPQDLIVLENIFMERSKFPKGAFTAIAASLDGDLDSFAAGIDDVTSREESNEFTDIRGLPALLVSLVRSDGHANMSVFRKTIEALGSSREKLDSIARRRRSIKELIPGVLKNKGKFSHLMRRLPVLKRNALVDFIYASLVGGEAGRRIILRTISIFGFDQELATDLMALSDGGSEKYESLLAAGTTRISVHDSDDPESDEMSRKGRGTAATKPVFSVLSEVLMNGLVDQSSGKKAREKLNKCKVIAKHMLNVLSTGFNGLGKGRTGVCVPLLNVATSVLEQKENIDVIDGLFLAQTDAPSHQPLLVKCISLLLDLLEVYPKNRTERTRLSSLLAGIMCLASPTDSVEEELKSTMRAKNELAVSLRTSPDIVGFCMGLARSDMLLVSKFARQVGEFDLKVVEDLNILIGRLVPILKQEGNDDDDSQSEKEGQKNAKNASNRERKDDHTISEDDTKIISSGTSKAATRNSGQFSAEALFQACVSNGTKYMDFGEFKLATKLLALNMHNQALRSWFLSGDKLGSGLLTEQMFVKVIETEMMKMAKKVLVIRKAEYGSLIMKLVVMILTLISLLAFILLGWHSLGMSGGFAAGTGSSVLAGIGRLMGKLGEDEEDDGGGGGSRGSDESNDDGNENGTSVSGPAVSGNEDEQTQTALDEVVKMIDADN